MDPDASSYLYTIAEVAVTLAGFSGIVVALLGRDSVWRENDRAGMMLVLLTCAYALVLSLLPVALAFFAIAEAVIWNVTSALAGAAFVAAAVLFVWLRRRMVPRLALLFNGFLVLSVLLGIGLMAGAALALSGPGILALALLWLLLVAFVQLATFIAAASSGRL